MPLHAILQLVDKPVISLHNISRALSDSWQPNPALDAGPIRDIRPFESHSGARGNIIAEPPNIFTGPLWEKIFEFFFSKWYILAYFIFLADDGAPQTSRGPG